MDLFAPYPDWLICGLAIVGTTIVLQVVSSWSRRSIDRIGRQVDAWQQTQPGLADVSSADREVAA